MSDTTRPAPEQPGAAERAEDQPESPPLQLLGDPDATVCTDERCDIPAAPET